MLNNIKLRLPLRDIDINQPFGVNYVDFYKKLGLKGHNGIDFQAKDGCPCYSSIDGKVCYAGADGTGGICVEVADKVRGVKIINYHLKSVSVKAGQDVKAGELIGHCDNTGIYTTGDHLHFGLKEIDFNGATKNKDNGYNGAIDPSPYFEYLYNGQPIKNKDWDRPRCYHRYGKERNWLAEFCIRFAPIKYQNTWTKSGHWIQKQLLKYKLKILSAEQTNAIVYGAWDFDSIINTAMYPIYSQITKEEFLSGKKPFIN